MSDRIERLLAEMTLEEKISMLSGADAWRTAAVKRLGIPAIKVTDGPNGARGAYGYVGPTSACFPVGVALAATWNLELVRQVGSALAEEVKSKGAHILLAPTVNIHRSPLAGRNFECYSEDPYLTARMAVAYIQGLQTHGVGACIKHFVCNDSEFERRSISSEVAERPLHEIYLTPFRIALRDAKPWAVMSSYNRVNGTYASENRYLLRDLLKGEWAFDGIVISDWGGTFSDAAAEGGLDLEMPGPGIWMAERLLEAVQAGRVSQAVIDDKARRLLRTILRVGAFEQQSLPEERADDRPEHRRIARQAAVEAMVLLKNNDGILPLGRAQLSSVAVIGANARWPQIMGGGSSHVTPHYAIAPLEAIRSRAGDRVEVAYAIGCPIHRQLPPLNPDWLRAQDGGERGFSVEFFASRDLSGEPVRTTIIDRTRISWQKNVLRNVTPGEFSARLQAYLNVPESASYSLSTAGPGLSRLLVDGTLVVDNWSNHPADEQPWEPSEVTGEVQLTAGKRYRLVVEYSSRKSFEWTPFRIGCVPTVGPDAIDAAAALAARCDVAIVFAGLTDDWESEGFDRLDMELPGAQAELIERVAAANHRTVVVLNAGSPVTMNWLEQVPAAVQAWYAGQEAGNAIADLLFGDVNPSGRLPTTFPRRLKDNPAYLNYPGENGKVHYGEGLFVGYRYYDKKGIEPLFPFGHGLSYTTFEYRDLTLSAGEYSPGDEINVSVTLENTGKRTGYEVIQLYVRDLQSSLVRPEKELKAFAKVSLDPGEIRTVPFILGPEALAFYDPARAGWVTEAGDFEVLIGRSAADICLTKRFFLRDDLATGAERKT